MQNYYFSSEIVVTFQKSFVLFAISSAVVDVENAWIEVEIALMSESEE